MKSKEKNMHAGHRKRLREMVDKTGMFNLSDLQFLEILLQFVIPRGDTNPIAHQLLAEFKTIDNILGANVQALQTIPGIGEKTGRFLNFMECVSFMYEKAKAQQKPFVGTFNTAIPYIERILPPTDKEQFVILIVGKNYKVKNYKIFKGISHSLINFSSSELSEYLINHKGNFCILAHTHPEASANPSNTDIKTFECLTPLFDSMSIQILDNLILGEENYYSFRMKSLRNYKDLETDLIAGRKFTSQQ